MSITFPGHWVRPTCPFHKGLWCTLFCSWKLNHLVTFPLDVLLRLNFFSHDKDVRLISMDNLWADSATCHILHEILSVTWQQSYCIQQDWILFHRKSSNLFYMDRERNALFHIIIITIINPLTTRVVGAPQMILQPVFSIFPCSPLPSGTCRIPGLSIPRCCLPTSSSVCLVFFPLSLCLAKQFWPDLMNRRLDHTIAVCVSLRWSGGLRVVQLPAGTWHGLPIW